MSKLTKRTVYDIARGPWLKGNNGKYEASFKPRQMEWDPAVGMWVGTAPGGNTFTIHKLDEPSKARWLTLIEEARSTF